MCVVGGGGGGGEGRGQHTNQPAQLQRIHLRIEMQIF